jgi:hypothetical protein
MKTDACNSSNWHVPEQGARCACRPQCHAVLQRMFLVDCVYDGHLVAGRSGHAVQLEPLGYLCCIYHVCWALPRQYIW